jgi:hypothetical protein
MTRTRLIAAGGTLAAAIVAALIVFIAQQGSGSKATAYEVAQKAVAHELQLTAAFGPNTTVHQVVINHLSSEKASLNHEPQDTRSDGWWAFGPDGRLSAYRAQTTDLSGQTVVSTQERDASGALTETKDGRTQTIIQNYTLAAADVASNFNNAIVAAKDKLTAPDAAAPEDASGTNYIISTPHERQYIDKTTFRLTKVEELDDSGNVTSSKEFPTLDVSDGDTVPTAGPVATATP